MAEQESATFEAELSAYLQERIKPGLNSGAIPLLARSIAKEIAHRAQPNGQAEDARAEDEPSAETDEDPSAEADDEPSAEGDEDEAGDESEARAEDDDEASAEDDDEASAEDDDDADAQGEPSAEGDDEAGDENETPPDFEADMRELQAELGDEWILSFSVQGEDGWLTAETGDGHQHVEAQTAAALTEAVQLLKDDGGRSG
jgi:hypothetical protein